ncbi:MAG TPA: rhomboid family intramembrane serine protease [Nocardioides sp.]|nr:rhomboid family intramembrane serine protease [Nocardioides sp.]
MSDAAVGFQCPACVAEGARTTRQGRTAYGGRRSGNPALTSMVLIALNVAVWLAVVATGGRAGRLVDLLALQARGRCEAADRTGYFPDAPEQACQLQDGVIWIGGVADGSWWQPLTSMFTHVEVWHLGFNMLALWFLGPQLEAAVGRLRFLALYLVSGLTGSALVYWLAAEQVQTLGASGAVFGLMGALLVVAVKVRGNVSQIGVWLLMNAVITFTFPGISWQGHLGGFVGGVLIGAAVVYAPRGPRRRWWQWLGVGAVTLAVLASLAVRTAALA